MVLLVLVLLLRRLVGQAAQWHAPQATLFQDQDLHLAHWEFGQIPQDLAVLLLALAYQIGEIALPVLALLLQQLVGQVAQWPVPVITFCLVLHLLLAHWAHGQIPQAHVCTMILRLDILKSLA